MQNPLNVMAPIKQNEKAALEDLLSKIGSNINKNSYLRFSEIETTHFARFVLVGGGTVEDRDAKTSLVFTSNHDGSGNDYFDLLAEKAPLAMAEIWCRCEGFPSLKPTDENFKVAFRQFMAQHTLPTQTYYAAYPEYTVSEIKAYNALRQPFEALLNRPELEPFFRALSQIPPAPVTITFREKIDLFLNKISPEARIFSILFYILERTLGPKIDTSPITAISKEVNTRPDLTDSVDTVQNAMSVITAMKPADAAKLKRLLGVLNYVTTHNPTPGSLAGLTTIHFGRWFLLGNSSNMFFESNYDGNWEQYIGDFVDKADAIMDLVWGSALDYPRHGAKDLQSFKKLIIDHQVPTQVFYSAYPRESVKNILNNIETGKAIARILGQKDIATCLSGL